MKFGTGNLVFVKNKDIPYVLAPNGDTILTDGDNIWVWKLTDSEDTKNITERKDQNGKFNSKRT